MCSSPTAATADRARYREVAGESGLGGTAGVGAAIVAGHDLEILMPRAAVSVLVLDPRVGKTVTQDPVDNAKAAAARGDFETAISVLRPSAEAGSHEAQYELGFLAMTECELISGREALSLFTMAAEQGHAEAMYELAKSPEFIGEPFKSPLSDEEAWQWLLRAAELGCVQAQYDAAASLATGDWGKGHVAKNLEAAVAWYRRAAEAGHAEAQFNLASMLSEGEGCERDIPEARKWLRRSVAGGYEYAEGLLAHLDSLKQR